MRMRITRHGDSCEYGRPQPQLGPYATTCSSGTLGAECKRRSKTRHDPCVNLLTPIPPLLEWSLTHSQSMQIILQRALVTCTLSPPCRNQSIRRDDWGRFANTDADDFKQWDGTIRWHLDTTKKCHFVRPTVDKRRGEPRKRFRSNSSLHTVQYINSFSRITFRNPKSVEKRKESVILPL
ncbi:hypothetical protein BJV78DRAFT_501528 [Lactifluus subvellereus]|nr:hypothetical protein BJV78DRAFT_501528 [Lactifluus subvellereus]